MALPLLCIAGGVSLAGYGISCLAGHDENVAAATPPATLMNVAGSADEGSDMMKAALTPEKLEALKASGKRFAIVVFAPWCSVCKYFKGTFRKAVDAGVPLYSIDGDAHPDAVDGIEAFPTIVMYDEKGQEAKRHMGGMDVGPLRKFLLDKKQR